MNQETEIATQPTVREPMVTHPAPLGPTAEEPPPAPVDPLASITLTPRTFAAVLAVAGMLLGLILALVPVHVAGLDTTEPTSVSCGNTIGGVETPLVGEDLRNAGDEVLATYVGTCQQAISTRLLVSWPLFVAGALGIVWLGVVRRDPPRQLA
ncbi:MAG TPA: hypothetical protein VGP26_19730 [Actinophytocola sp.]|jgi:hypothetical protein|nr:hypothetical protein [Actinophytocola sp.]